MSATKVVAIALIAVVIGFGLGWGITVTGQRQTGENALRLEALAKANQVEGAVSALALPERNDVAGLKQELEVQITSGLTKLHVLSAAIAGSDAVLIREAIQKGEEYATKHGLKVVRPSK